MKIKVVKTVRNCPPMEEIILYSVPDKDGRENVLICLNPEVEYQEIEGFGGAFTEAAAVTLKKLSKENQDKILRLYFSKEEGIGYNIGRIHMNSCDFSESNYACVEENDQTLDSFHIDRDKQAVIPMLREAMKYGEIQLFMSPWSPPAYMKTNGEMNHGGKLKEEFRELWAQCYAKFIEAYRGEGIDIWGISVQNEPKAVQKWDSCVYTAEEERDFVKDHLGKKMEELGVKILFWDHNKERIIERSRVMLGDPEAAKYIYGVAFHWYSGDHFEQLDMFHSLYPDKKLVFSEGCYEYSKGQEDTYKIGEKYAHDIIGNFNNYCTMFCDWNLLLNEQGGPNHVGNYCDAPIMADTENDKVYLHESYYYIGHFSKYIKQGAKRVGSSKWTEELETVAFKNPNGTIVSVVLNRTDRDIAYYFSLNGQLVDAVAEGHSIATYILGV